MNTISAVSSSNRSDLYNRVRGHLWNRYGIKNVDFVEVDSTVKITGRVPLYYHKQLAQAVLIEAMAKMEEAQRPKAIDNQVEVI